MVSNNSNDVDECGTEQKREEYRKAMQELAEAKLEDDDRPKLRGDGMPEGSPPPEVL